MGNLTRGRVAGPIRGGDQREVSLFQPFLDRAQSQFVRIPISDKFQMLGGAAAQRSGLSSQLRIAFIAGSPDAEPNEVC
jgi:hypothetical protein